MSEVIPSKRTSIRELSLWSFLRAVLSQGGDIYLDHREKPYELYSARLDAAASERADELEKALQSSRDETSRRLAGTLSVATGEVTPVCPDCSKVLHKVTRPGGSMLNDDQFDAVRAGDWYCDTCPSNGRGNTRYRYFWNHEIRAVEPKAPPKCNHSLNQGTTLVGNVSDGLACSVCGGGPGSPVKASAHIVGDRCSNWPCQLLRFHDGPCSTAKNGTPKL